MMAVAASGMEAMGAVVYDSATCGFNHPGGNDVLE